MRPFRVERPHTPHTPLPHEDAVVEHAAAKDSDVLEGSGLGGGREVLAEIGADVGRRALAAADGQVVRAGWAGGYGRQVRIAHGGGVMTSYSHMSEIVAAPGSFVHAGQLIGYVGSSGLSTGPHLHYEVRRDGVAVNPLSVRFASTYVADADVANAVKARLKVLLSVGAKRS